MNKHRICCIVNENFSTPFYSLFSTSWRTATTWRRTILLYFLLLMIGKIIIQMFQVCRRYFFFWNSSFESILFLNRLKSLDSATSNFHGSQSDWLKSQHIHIRLTHNFDSIFSNRNVNKQKNFDNISSADF